MYVKVKKNESRSLKKNQQLDLGSHVFTKPNAMLVLQLAGVVEPNDGLCHMEMTAGIGMLSKAASLQYDYPSISQVT